MAPALLSDDQIELALASLPGFRRDGAALVCRYRFGSFAAAVAFTNELARIAERMDHHPDWCVSFRRVDVRTTTHDRGGVTRLDVELARSVAAAAAAAAATAEPMP